MVKRKQKYYERQTSNVKIERFGNAPLNSTKKTRIKSFTILDKIPFVLVEFLVLWSFLYFWYGDVLYVAEQRSIFSFDATVMNAYLSQPLGWLYAIGRFMLLSCKIPLFGSMLISCMLIFSAWLIRIAFNIRDWFCSVIVVLPFAYFVYFFYMGLNLMYLRESSWVMTIPLISLVLSGVIAIVSWFGRKKRISSFRFKFLNANKLSQVYFSYVMLVFFFCGSIVTAETYAQNDRITCSMERLMYEEKWDEMVSVAKKASQPSRTVVALYAIALNQNGQLATELFNIPMQYKNAHLSRRDGSFDGGIDFIIIYGNFYAGLTKAAYHEAMEQTVLDGPSINKIKMMIKCALIDRENKLVEKYLAILKTVPFEKEFAAKYENMLSDYSKVTSDAELASVIELQPVNDNFEQSFREPLFLGYNVTLREAKSIRGLNNSLYACLYSKDLQSFGQRIITMIQNKVMLPKVFEEAIVVQNIKHLSDLKQLKLSPYTLQGMKDFVSDCFTKSEKPHTQMTKEEKNNISKEKAKKFKDKYLGTYQYYYYFQNVPDENYVVPGKDEKGGVN